MYPGESDSSGTLLSLLVDGSVDFFLNGKLSFYCSLLNVVPYK